MATQSRLVESLKAIMHTVEDPLESTNNSVSQMREHYWRARYSGRLHSNKPYFYWTISCGDSQVEHRQQYLEVKIEDCTLSEYYLYSSINEAIGPALNCGPGGIVVSIFFFVVHFL